MKQFVLHFIRIYQAASKKGFLGTLLSGGSCKYTPTCSEYTYQAVSQYGTIRGLILGARRILKCHPFSHGGYDPVR